MSVQSSNDLKKNMYDWAENICQFTNNDQRNSSPNEQYNIWAAQTPQNITKL